VSQGRARINVLVLPFFPVGIGELMQIGDVVLRIVHSSIVIVHEEVDPRRVERLTQRMQADGILKNPPVVAEAGDHYVVLDGATRVGALRQLGIRDLLVQVVDYHAPNIQLYAWSHVVVGMPEDALIRGVENLEGVEVKAMDLELARSALSLKGILCYLVLQDGSILAAKGGMNLEAQIALLNHIVDLYRGRAEVYRVATDEIEDLLEEYPDLTAVVVFPCYNRGEIMRMSLNRAKLPMGVTRHIIAGRALGLDVDLVMLESDIPLEQKNVWLDDLIKRKAKDKRIRFYQEPLFRFDE
jgi:hypothetical protein